MVADRVQEVVETMEAGAYTGEDFMCLGARHAGASASE